MADVLFVVHLSILPLQSVLHVKVISFKHMLVVQINIRYNIGLPALSSPLETLSSVGTILLLIVIVSSVTFLGLVKGGNSQTIVIVKTVVVHDQPTQISTIVPAQIPTAAPTQQIATPIPPTPTIVPDIEVWAGTIQRDTSNWVSTYYAELHVTNIGQNASFQGMWCEDLTDQKDLYGHSMCTNSMPIAGSWVAFSKLGTGLQTDINNSSPNTTHDPIILWGGQAGADQGNLCQNCRYYASTQNNQLNGLLYWGNGDGPHGKFNFTLQSSGASKLGY